MDIFKDLTDIFTGFEYQNLFNVFDIIFIIITSISILYAFKKGLVNSFLNLIKWILIVFAIKFSFPLLHPIFNDFDFIGEYLASVSVFLSVLVVSYILLSFINRILIGIIQPKRSLFIDLFLGGMFGLLRGYIIAVLIFSLTNSMFDIKRFKSINNAIFIDKVEMGASFLGEIPKRFEEKLKDIEKSI